MALGERERKLLEECRVDFFVASGPGGQHRNKTESGVRLVHLSTGIIVTATERRSRQQNMQAALERLKRRLAVLRRPKKFRRPTQPTAAGRARRLEAKRRRAASKVFRRRPAPEQE